MTLVIPDLSETNANYSAQLAWASGCQFAGMCFQNFDTNMEVYSAFFAKKGSAFALKPEALRYIPVTIPPLRQQILRILTNKETLPRIITLLLFNILFNIYE